VICQRYTPKKKKQTFNTWESRIYRQIKLSKSPKPNPAGQMALPLADKSPLNAIVNPDISG
jgi:hypothetical protein